MDFKETIREQRAAIEKAGSGTNIIQREQHAYASQFIRNPNILAITGVRRSGKSIFSYLLAKGSNFGYVNFDDERIHDVRTEDLNSMLQAMYSLYGDVDTIVLDEVQRAPKWELFASRLRVTKKLIVTGSNSTLLSGELATHLTGRYIDVTVHPFSFREFLVGTGFEKQVAYTTLERAKIISNLNEYMEVGGFPEVRTVGPEILSRIYNDIVFKDIVQRYKIRKMEVARHLATYLVSGSGNEITYSSLSKALDIKSVDTVAKWVSYIERAFLVTRLERFDYKLKHRVKAPKKFYCIDTGLAKVAGFHFSKNTGNTMENVVAIDLQRWKSKQYGRDVYYWKDHQQREVDFILKNGPEVQQLVQVTYASDRREVPERELTSLGIASKALRCKNLLVITWDYEGEERLDGRIVKFTPLWKWLLEQT
jgi:predicted AAA+ superfamily ATPase